MVAYGDTNGEGMSDAISGLGKNAKPARIIDVARAEIELPSREADPKFWAIADVAWEALQKDNREGLTQEEAALILAARFTQYNPDMDYRKVKE
jgi:hypothetical protein